VFSSKINGSPAFHHMRLLSYHFHICHQTTAATIQMTALSLQQTAFTMSWLRHHNILFSLSDYYHPDPNHQRDSFTVCTDWVRTGWTHELYVAEGTIILPLLGTEPCQPTSKPILIYWAMLLILFLRWQIVYITGINWCMLFMVELMMYNKHSRPFVVYVILR
jgi:hypothetical protein